MRIDRVTLTTGDLDGQAAYYADRLGLPVEQTESGVDIAIGESTLEFRPGPAPEPGQGHHVAFSVPAAKIQRAADWLAERVEVLHPDGSPIVASGPGWNSRSVYFWGPENSILEVIGRFDVDELRDSPADDSSVSDGGFGPTDILDISEIGIPSADPRVLAGDLEESVGLPRFTPFLEKFVPVGDQHGLLILTHSDRVWFPTEATRPARTPIEIRLRAPKSGTGVSATESCTITADPAGLPTYLGPNPTK